MCTKLAKIFWSKWFGFVDNVTPNIVQILIPTYIGNHVHLLIYLYWEK